MRRIIFILAAGVILAWGCWGGWLQSGVQQPIAFPHKTHLALGLACTTCHQRAEKDVVAGRPPTALCFGCHAAGETNSPEIKKIRTYGEKGQEIPWKRVWRLPSHVYFPHRVHVTVAQLKCQTCHGPMETLDRPPTRPLRKLTMDDCIDCHQKRELAKNKEEKVAHGTKVAGRPLSIDCNTCHR